MREPSTGHPEARIGPTVDQEEESGYEEEKGWDKKETAEEG